MNNNNSVVKMRLIEALFELLKEKNLTDISISQLCTSADVSRMSFYRNYSSIDDILLQLMNQLFDTYREEFEALGPQTEFYDEKNLEHCFRSFKANADYLRVIYLSGLGQIFLDKLTDYVISIWYKKGDSADRYITLVSFAGSLYNIYHIWLLQGEDSASVEQLSRIVHSIYEK